MHADVVVVGAGASGAIVSRSLAQAGFSVVCLEQGEWVSTSRYPSGELERELIAMKEWSIDPNVRQAPADYPCDVAEAELHPSMFNAVGGSTVHYAGEWPRMIPSDFRVRTLTGLADDWPISYEDLERYYERVDRIVGASGLEGDPAYPPGVGPPMPAIPINKAGRKAAEGMNAMGWHWWPGTQAIASERYGNQHACTRRGVCVTGCPEGAKSSFDLTVWPAAIAAGARVVTGARVSTVTTDVKGLANGVEWIDRAGAAHRQTADIVILAANGVGTPRLLLMSDAEGRGEGLANSSGLVGKRLMMHPFRTVLGVYEEQLESWLGPAGQALTSMQFAETEQSRGFPRGTKWNLVPLPGPLDVLHRYSAASLVGDDTVSVQETISRVLGRAFEWAVTAEDLPEERNSVTLSSDLVDGDGLPAPKIRYRTSEATVKTLEFGAARAAEAHRAGGAVETHVIDWGPGVGWHLMGTTKMGTDPTDSVVDAYGRCHDVSNLYIVDGSVFVTSSCVNPTPTLSALAERTAEHIIVNARSQAIAS